VGPRRAEPRLGRLEFSVSCAPRPKKRQLWDPGRPQPPLPGHALASRRNPFGFSSLEPAPRGSNRPRPGSCQRRQSAGVGALPPRQLPAALCQYKPPASSFPLPTDKLPAAAVGCSESHGLPLKDGHRRLKSLSRLQSLFDGSTAARPRPLDSSYRRPCCRAIYKTHQAAPHRVDRRPACHASPEPRCDTTRPPFKLKPRPVPMASSSRSMESRTGRSKQRKSWLPAGRPILSSRLADGRTRQATTPRASGW